MGRNKYCQPCALRGIESMAAMTVDDEPMCRMCADAADGERAPDVRLAAFHGAALVPPSRLCGRGCGQPKHRGKCKAAEPAPPAVSKPYAPGPRHAVAVIPRERPAQECAAAVMIPAQGGFGEICVGRIDEIPLTSINRTGGLTAKLWEQMQRLLPGESLKVPCGDMRRLGKLRARLARRAVRAGAKLEWRRDDETLWVWLSR